jgi:hypothetical protein
MNADILLNEIFDPLRKQRGCSLLRRASKLLLQAGCTSS